MGSRTSQFNLAKADSASVVAARGEIDYHAIIYRVTSTTTPSAEPGTCRAGEPHVHIPQWDRTSREGILAHHPTTHPLSGSYRGVSKPLSVATPQRAADAGRDEGWALQRQSGNCHSLISRRGRCSILRTWATQVPSGAHCRAGVQIHIEATVTGSLLLWPYDAKLPRHLLINTKPPGNGE